MIVGRRLMLMRKIERKKRSDCSRCPAARRPSRMPHEAVRLEADRTRSGGDSRRCVYCNSRPGVTRDHVPPKSFFPQPRPANLITVPACSECNGGFSKDEDLFLAAFMFSSAGISEVGQAIWRQTLRRAYSKNPGLRWRISRSIQEVEVSTPAGLYLGRRMTIRPDERRSAQFVAKIVRGLYHHEFGIPLAWNAEITSYWIRTASEGQEIEKFRDQLLHGSRGWSGVFEYRFNRVADQPNDSMWVIRFFGQFVFWCISNGDGVVEDGA